MKKTLNKKRKYNFEINIEDIEMNKGVELDADDIWECIHYILENIDEKRSICDILSLVEKQIKRNINFEQLLNIFKRLYKSFVLYDLILLTY